MKIGVMTTSEAMSFLHPSLTAMMDGRKGESSCYRVEFEFKTDFYKLLPTQLTLTLTLTQPYFVATRTDPNPIRVKLGSD